MKEIEKRNKELIEEVEKLRRQVKILRDRKKYGLVWEEEKEPEQIVLDCQVKIPILKEVKSKEIISDKEKPVNVLIEGDNYHALSVLNYTHKGKVDVIYIDPPYNTGKVNEWRYNDKYVDENDVYKHSKWLSFISKRLVSAKNLLREDGVIFVSIDDNEFAQLKLLCDEIFNGGNFIACLPTVMNLKGNNDQFGFSGTHEYTLVYSKNKILCSFNDFILNDEELRKWEKDEIGFYKKGAELKATSYESTRKDRPKMYYPFLYDKTSNTLTTITEEEAEKIYDNNSKKFNDKYVNILKDKYENKGFKVILPIKSDGRFGRWVWGYSQRTIDKIKTEVIIRENGSKINIYKKIRPSLGGIPTKRPKTLFYKPEYSSSNGISQIKELFGKRVFENPKPLELIKDFIHIGSNKDSIILDFMAGSGTTGHAVLKLNKEDGGNRKFILCTNNENNICTEVCYPRIEKVIKGYRNLKGKQVKGLGGNLRFFRTELLDVDHISHVSDGQKIKLTYKAGEMIALRENTFEEVEKNNWWEIFKNGTKYTAIYFKEDKSKLNELAKKLGKLEEEIVLYIFSWGKNEYKNEFTEYKNIKVEDIPEPIIDVYKEVNRLS